MVAGITPGLVALFLFVQPLVGKKNESVRLSSPEVHLAGWNARCLNHADLNGDGLQDLVYFNLDRSRIEILYRCREGETPPRVRPVERDRWEPVLEDAPYLKERIFVAGNLTSLAIGDLNRDGLHDLVQGSPEDGVFVHFRESNSTWSEPVSLETGKIRPFSKSLRIPAARPEDSAALFLFTSDGLEKLVFEDGKPSYPSTLAREDGKRAYGTELSDVDGDGIPDWMYLVPEDEDSLKLRLGHEKGFGPESSFDLKLSSFPIPLFSKSSEGRQRFCSIDAVSNEALVFSFEKRTKENFSPELKVRSYDLFSESNKQAAWAMDDFDDNGISDLVVTDSSLGELLYLSGKPNGQFGSANEVPSLRGISAIHSVRRGGKRGPSLLILSRDEEALGLADFDSQGFFNFPQMLPNRGSPLLACTTDWDSDGVDEILAVTEDDSDFFLETWKLDDGGKPQKLTELELKDWSREPAGLFPCHLNRDGIMDLFVLSGRDAPTLLLGNSSGSWEEVAQDSVVRKSFLKGAGPSRLGLSKKANSKMDEILICGKGFVRSVIWDSNDFKVTDQFNSSDQGGDLSIPQWLDTDGDGKKELFAFHSEGYWERLTESNTRGGTKTGAQGSMNKPIRSFVLKSGKRETLASMGSSGFQLLSQSLPSDLSVKVEARHLTDLPGIRYSGIDWGDFNGDQQADLVCLDGRRNLLEFLCFDSESQELSSVLHFRTFEKNMHYQGKKGGAYEPREGLVIDLDGDRLDDLVFLVHDRLLCYYQVGGKGK